MTQSFSNILLGVGTIEIMPTSTATASTTIGFTRGAEFNDNYTTRNIEVDGRVSPLVGEKVVESTEPTLSISALQMSSSNLDLLFSGITVATVSADKTITRSHSLADADYLHSVTYTGTTNAGKFVKIKLNNCLANTPINLAFEDQTEVVIPVTFTAHNSITANSTLPYEITFVAEV